MSSRWGIAAALVAAILLCVFLYGRFGANGSAEVSATALRLATDRLAPTPGEESAGEAPGAFPASLMGTQEDGALLVDAHGRFHATPDAIDLFDYYLSALGEESEDRIRARIVAVIEARLAGEAARAAIALLDDYLIYRTRAASELSGSFDGIELERRLQYIRELRRDVFGPTIARALFAEEEERWFVDLERRRLVQDDSLDPADRDNRLAEIDEKLSESERERLEAPLVHRLLRDEEARLRSSGADAGDIDRFREERFGRESATRLAALDASRLEWQEKLDAYRGERDRLLAKGDSQDRGERIEALRAQHFKGGELVRVRALDQIEGEHR